MAGVTAIAVKESLDDLAKQLRPADTSIANGFGKHRNTVQTWRSMYRNGGIEAMLKIKKSPGGVRVIPQWGATLRGAGFVGDAARKLGSEEAVAKRLQDRDHGLSSYGEVQQWLAERLGIEAEYHAVYQMTRDRLQAKLKVARPQNTKQDPEQREAVKKTWQTRSIC